MMMMTINGPPRDPPPGTETTETTETTNSVTPATPLGQRAQGSHKPCGAYHPLTLIRHVKNNNTRYSLTPDCPMGP